MAPIRIKDPVRKTPAETPASVNASPVGMLTPNNQGPHASATIGLNADMMGGVLNVYATKAMSAPPTSPTTACETRCEGEVNRSTVTEFRATVTVDELFRKRW